MAPLRNFIGVAIFAIVYVHCIDAINENIKLKTIYAYKGKTLVRNSISDKHVSVWTVSGKLIHEDFYNKVVFKLEDVKTKLFNGDPANLNKYEEKEVPEEAKVIQEPFYVTRPGNEPWYNITHKSDEPLWSVNMKKSIATIFWYDFEKKFKVDNTISGDCVVTYKEDTENKISYKTIDHTQCKNKPAYDESNVQKIGHNFQPLNIETKRIYHFNGPQNFKKVESYSTITYQSMPSVRSKQIIEQKQEFTELSSTDTFEPMDTSALTKTTDVLYDFSEGIDGGRDLSDENKTPEELITDFETSYKEYKEYLKAVPLKHIDLQNDNDTLSNMYDALESMDKDTLHKMGKRVFKKEDYLLEHTFISNIPYLGTNESLLYMRDLIVADSLNDLLAIKILAIFPPYVEKVNENMLQEMEILANLNVSNPQVNYAGILSFASLVGQAVHDKSIDEKMFKKYYDMYYQKYESADNYETKMVYLSGLLNLNKNTQVDTILSLITNHEISIHLRVLAAYGFKKFTTYTKEQVDKMYNELWPIVKNRSEPIEIRVKCLDVLMYSDISDNQFETIVNWYHDELSDPSEQHLANYFYTTLKALQNSTGFHETLENKATEVLQTIKPLKYNRAWSTGSYRIAFTDKEANFGAYFQARLVADPISNQIIAAHITTGGFSHSLDIGRYSAYIKVEGISDVIFSFLFLSDESEMYSVPKLLKLLKENAYKLKEVTEDFHIEITLYDHDRIIFTMYINQNTLFRDNPLIIDLLKLVVAYNSISYPVYNYNHLMSDFGTGVQINTDFFDIVSYEVENFDKLLDDSDSSISIDLDNLPTIEYTLNYRSIHGYNLYSQCYNPLAGGSTATYKYIAEEKRINIPLSFNLTDLVFKWKHEKDAFNYVVNHLIGTNVDDGDVLYKYCADCSAISEVSDGEPVQVIDKNKYVSYFGIYFNKTLYSTTDEQIALNEISPARNNTLTDVFNNLQVITFDSSVKPVLLLWHYLLYNKYIVNDVYRMSINSEPFFDEPIETVLDLDVTLDDLKLDGDPISGTESDLWISFTTRKQNDAEELSFVNATMKYASESKSTNGTIQPHIEYEYDFELVLSKNGNTQKLCIEREVFYPNRKTNKYSLETIDDGKSITKLFWDTVENKTTDCSKQDLVIVTEIYKTSKNQKNKLLTSNAYTKCKKHAKDLKYIPPTEECLAAHEIISKYDSCNIYVDLPKKNEFRKYFDEIPKTEYGIEVISYTQINNTHVKATLGTNFLSYFVVDPDEIKKIIETPQSLEMLSVNPRSVAYDDYETDLGLTSECHITPNRIRTFTGNTIKKYFENEGKEPVAFIECINMTKTGMTIQKYGDNHVGFQFISMNDTIVGSVNDGKLKIEINGNAITETTEQVEDRIDVYFLDTDVVFINGDVDIFYTTEYITVKVYSIYNNYLCGLCTEINNR